MSDQSQRPSSTRIPRVEFPNWLFVAAITIFACIALILWLRPRLQDSQTLSHNAVLRSEYFAQIAKWRSSGITHYRFHLTRDPSLMCLPATIEVLNNEVIAVKVESLLDTDEDCLTLLQGWTVDKGIYGEFGMELEGYPSVSRPIRVDVTYQDYGVPSKIIVTNPNLHEVQTTAITDLEILDDD